VSGSGTGNRWPWAAPRLPWSGTLADLTCFNSVPRRTAAIGTLCHPGSD